jgi:hypothetical protein
MTKQLDNLAKHFSIGMTIFVERRMGGQNIKTSTRVIGAYDPCFLLVEVPLYQGSPLFSQNGDICIVRFLHHGTLRGFKAEIERVILEPFSMLILRCPKHIEEKALRKHERLECNLTGILSLNLEATPLLYRSKEEMQAAGTEASNEECPLQPEMKVTLLDLAVGGCQVALPLLDAGELPESVQEVLRAIPENERRLYRSDFLREVMQKGFPCQLSFEIPQPVSKKFIDIACSVQWNRQAAAHYLVGLGFLEPAVDMIESIRSIIDYHHQFFCPCVRYPMET